MQQITIPTVCESDVIHYLKKRTPFICKNLDVGPCISLWRNVEYLREKVGSKRVVVHVTTDLNMDFLAKNFKYKTMEFTDLLQTCADSERSDKSPTETDKYYLRSLADDQRDGIASIQSDFPNLWPDLKIPRWYLDSDQLFSSVLRLSSAGIRMWIHYDVLDNVLLQIVGSKKVCLFRPQDALLLYLNGDKSEVINFEEPDLERFPKFQEAVQYVGTLEPGDALFIPALWFHGTRAIDYSVGVNAFWKNLDAAFYDRKDVYGNKDLLPAARAFQGLERAVKALHDLPPEYRDFYGRRMVQYIQKTCFLDAKVT